MIMLGSKVLFKGAFTQTITSRPSVVVVLIMFVEISIAVVFAQFAVPPEKKLLQRLRSHTTSRIKLCLISTF